MLMRTKFHVWAVWFCTNVDTFESRNSTWPPSVQWLHGMRPLETEETPAPPAGETRITSPWMASAHVTTVKLEALPCTTNAAMAELVEPEVLNLSAENPAAPPSPLGAFGPPPGPRLAVFTGDIS